MCKKPSYLSNCPLFSPPFSLLLSFSPPLLSFLSFSSSPLFFNILLEAPQAHKKCPVQTPNWRGFYKTNLAALC